MPGRRALRTGTTPGSGLCCAQVNGPLWHPFSIQITEKWPAIREELLGLRYHLHGDLSALESKEDMMERLGRSPDFADALTMTFLAEAVIG